jgi:GxxExxY protein
MADALTEIIIGAALKVHSTLGPGLLESAYEKCLLFELHQLNLNAVAQVELPIKYGQVTIDAGYRIDILVEDKVILELKSVSEVLPIHRAQLLSYLKLSRKRVGLLLNFNVVHLKDGIIRVVNG